jgi:adenylate cyclase
VTGWWARRRLRTKIFLPFSVLIVTVLLATLWLISAAVGGWVEGSLKSQFEVTGEVFDGLVAEREERLRGETTLLAGDFALKRALATYDPDTLTSVAMNYRDRIGGDLLWITDESGGLLADSRERLVAGTPLGEQPPLADAISASEPSVAVTEVDGGLMLLVAVPVLAPDPIGFLVAGELLDDATASRLEASTGPAVTFLTRERVFASSWAAAQRDVLFPGGRARDPRLERELAQASPTAERSTFLVDLAGERLLSVLLPVDARLAAPLFVLVQQSYDAALGPLAHLPERVAAIGAAALLAALVVGVLIAAGIARPLQALVGAMRRVLQGDLAQRLEVRRDDELGFLGRSFNEMVAGLEERERIKEIFGRFVSRDVAAAVLSGPLPLEGERREVTILFQDVRGFTAIAERLDPRRLVRLINLLFTEVVAAVESQGGVIRVFTGDGVMALFGAPIGHADDPARAVRAALDVVARLPALNERLADEGLPEIRIGIGIHHGDVVVGRIGPDQRTEYGVVGDAPNLASRIEGLTKEMQAMVLVSGATASRLGDEFELGRRAVLPVKGKELPVEVVEVIGHRIGLPSGCSDALRAPPATGPNRGA